VRRGGGLFWAALLGFVLVDLALLTLPRLAVLLSPARAAQVLAYLILGAAALALAWVAAAIAGAVAGRRFPGPAELLRMAVLVALLAGHTVLILRAR
jgi:hypothetical protein